MAIITKDGKLTNTAEDNRIVEEFLKNLPRVPVRDPETKEIYTYLPYLVCGEV